MDNKGSFFKASNDEILCPEWIIKAVKRSEAINEKLEINFWSKTMKCQIVCLECGKPKGANIGNKDLCQKTIGAVNFEILEKSREFVKSVSGIAKFHFRCDICNDVIKPGDRCYAETICQNEREYRQWETQWIETGEPDANS